MMRQETAFHIYIDAFQIETISVSFYISDLYNHLHMLVEEHDLSDRFHNNHCLLLFTPQTVYVKIQMEIRQCECYDDETAITTT